MCIFGGGKPPTTTQTNTLDPLTQQIRQYAIPRALDIMNQSFPSYEGERRLEPFNDDQRNLFGMVRDYAQGPQNPDYYNYAQQQTQSYGNAPAGYVSTSNRPGQVSTSGQYGRVGQEQRFQQMPQDIDTGRLVDEGGRLGKISDYMNPYVQKVIDPQIREIGRAADRARVQSGEAATFGGAFGDARHGVADSLTRGEEFNAKSDAAGRGWSDAYNQAMGLRSGDEARMMQADQFNQQAREQALARQLGAQQYNVGTQQNVAARQLQAAEFNQQLRQQMLARQLEAQGMNADLREAMFGRQAASANASMQYGTQNQQNYLQRMNAFANVGNQQQQQGQQLRNYDYENFQRGVNWPFTQFNTLLSMLNGQPNNPIQTQQTQTGGNSGWMNLIGSILGGMMPG